MPKGKKAGPRQGAKLKGKRSAKASPGKVDKLKQAKALEQKKKEAPAPSFIRGKADTQQWAPMQAAAQAMPANVNDFEGKGGGKLRSPSKPSPKAAQGIDDSLGGQRVMK